MTEYVLAIEGQETVDHRLIRYGALTWETPMPVWGVREEGRWDSPIVGTIEDVRRVEGSPDRAMIMATITWRVEPPTGVGLCAQLDTMESDYEDEPRLNVVTGGRLRAAFLGTPAWPETMIGPNKG